MQKKYVESIHQGNLGVITILPTNQLFLQFHNRDFCCTEYRVLFFKLKAVCLLSIQRAVIPSLDMLISTTLIVVMFTIWLQGGTIKLLVNLLGIDKETDKGKESI